MYSSWPIHSPSKSEHSPLPPISGSKQTPRKKHRRRSKNLSLGLPPPSPKPNLLTPRANTKPFASNLKKNKQRKKNNVFRSPGPSIASLRLEIPGKSVNGASAYPKSPMRKNAREKNKNR
eukprot:507733-Amorphochlora_amoeboformis.AAC.1